MEVEEQCPDSMEDIVVPDSLSPTIQDCVETVDATFEDIVQDGLDDIVLDSDDEGSELAGSVGIPLPKGTERRRDVGDALKVEERKLFDLGSLCRNVRKFCGHSPSPPFSSRSLVSGHHAKVMQHAATSVEVDTTNLRPSEYSDKCKLKQGISDHTNLRKFDVAINRRDSLVKRSVTNDAFCQEKTVSCRNETRIDARSDPSLRCHYEKTGFGDADYLEPGDASEEIALNFVDRFLAANNLDLPEKIGSGKANWKKSPPSIPAKGAHTMARKADSLRHMGNFDWSELQTCKGDLAKEFDEHIVGPSQYPSEKAEGGSNAREFYDVGFNTQIAAEAMEALMYSIPPSSEHAPQIKICNGSECTLKTNHCEVSTNLGMLSLDSETTWKQTEISHARPLDGNASCSSGKLSRNERGDPKVICREPFSENASCRRHPLGTKGKRTGRYSMVKCKRRERGTQEGLDSVVACANISITKSVECKNDVPMGFSNLAETEINQVNLRPSERFNGPICVFEKRKSCKIESSKRFNDPICVFKRRRSRKVESSKRFNDPICVFKRRKSCKVEFDVPDKKRALGIRDESSKLGSKESVKISCVKETKQAEIISDFIDLSHLLKFDPWNHPKGKRTHKCVPLLSGGSVKSSALSMLAIDVANEYHCKNRKAIKRRRVLLENNDVAIQSVLERPPSPTTPDHEDANKCLRGSCIGGFPTLARQNVPVEFDSGCSSKISTEFECRGTVSSVGNSENVKLDAATHETEESETLDHANICKKVRKTILSTTSLVKDLARLGYDKPLPGTVPRKSKRRNSMNVRVLFSQHLDSNIVNHQKKIIARLGFLVASCCSEATHFISDRFVRTRNMLEAIAHGKPVVTHFWLESCCQANSYIDEKNFILRDAEKENEIGFALPMSLAHATQNPLLQNKKVYVTPHVRPDTNLIQSLVKAVHGKVVGKNQIVRTKEACNEYDVLILSSAEDYTSCVPFLEKGASVYDSELLLTGIIIQKLEYERYRLFTKLNSE